MLLDAAQYSYPLFVSGNVNHVSTVFSPLAAREDRGEAEPDGKNETIRAKERIEIRKRPQILFLLFI